MVSLNDIKSGAWRTQFALSAGLSPNRQTSGERVAALIDRLRPRKTIVPLIRLGPQGDGGYLVPDRLSGVRACFSPGVGGQSGFELDCANRGIEVHMADGSVQGPAEPHPRFRFLRKHIGLADSSQTITLDTWMGSAGIGDEDELILQMDIEGFEYLALAALSQRRLRQCRYLIVEFHRLEQLWNEPHFEMMEAVFSKILLEHVCVHVHPNNSSHVWHRHGIQVASIMEFTFARRRDTEVDGAWGDFPHPLDCRNIGGKPDIALPHCWR